MVKTKSTETIKLVSSKRKRKLPPDPEGYNDQRAAQGKTVMDTYQKLTGADPSCSLGNLLCNLMHMCDRHPEFGSFYEVHARALQSYEEETATNEEYARFWS